MNDFENTVLTKLNNIINVLDAITNALTQVDEDVSCTCTTDYNHNPGCPAFPYT